MAKKEITDFGSKIGGARKDVWVKRGLCVEDIKDMTASEKEKYIKRDYIWPKPDIQEELEKGFSRFIVYWHNEMRKTVTSKKNIYISAEEYINGVRKIRSMVEAVKTEKEISDFEQRALDGVFLRKKYGRTYEYIAPFGNIFNGNKFLKNIGTYGHLNMKRKMGKENFAMTEDEIMKKQFPVIFIDGDKCSVAEDRGRSILIYKSGCSAYYCYPKPNVVLVDKTYVLIDERHNILFCGTQENCEKKQKEAFKEKKAVSKRKRKEKWIPKQFETLERSGETWRPQDKHINGEELIERYGIRAGEFGNWTNTLERQASLDQAYDAFADLAFALDIDEKSVSLPGLSCGSLAIAFGARGRGDAAAHYEPLREVINLTRLRGAGSLGHEWAHALDHLIGQSAGLSCLATEGRIFDYVKSLKKVLNRIHYNENGIYTQYYVDSTQFDKQYSKDSHGYWSSECELFARAFACYAVIVWKLTRISRNTIDLLKMISFFEKNGVHFVSYSEQFDTGTPVGKLMITLLASIAEFERETISDNVKTALRYRAEKGEPTATQILGYNRKDGFLYINHKEALLVQLIFKEYIKCFNYTEVARRMNKKGYCGKRGKPFRAHQIRIIITNATYCGYNLWERKIIKSHHAPIIKKRTFNRANKGKIHLD